MSNERRFGWGFSVLASVLLWCLVFAAWNAASAQQSVLPGYQICSSASGSTQCSFQPVDASHGLPVNLIAGTVTASLAPFGPSASGSRMTPLAVTTSDSSSTLPTGAAVVVTNVGANPMYCNVTGAAATTADQYIGAGNWYVFAPGVVTTLHCIATGSSTTANGVGGSGLPAGTGGAAGGSGGGGAVTVADGADVAEGALADASSSVGGTGSLSAKLRRMTTQLDTIQTAVQAAIPAGSAIIGKAGIDQTTPGTTNGVQVNGALPAGTNTIGTVGQLTYPVGATPITASATGTTGATTATLAGTSGKTTYICGYSIRANATAATTVTNTITGVITATLSSIMWVAPAASGLGVDEQIFSPCIPASGTNQAIAVVSGAPGTGGLVSSKGWGYQL